MLKIFYFYATYTLSYTICPVTARILSQSNHQNKIAKNLNLPTKIEFGGFNSISYIYNAIGQKVNKDVKTGSEYTNTDYLAGFQYRSSYTQAQGDQGTKELQYFPHTEGYVNKFKDDFNYVYHYTDHLGNIRLSYTLDKEQNMIKIMEENHYYPFGLKHEFYNTSTMKFKEKMIANEPKVVLEQVNSFVGDGSYNYKYNGKEYQDELGLNMSDYGWRNYMPDIGRWTQIDPLFNDLKFAHDINDVDPDDDEEVYMAIINDLEIGGGIYNTDNLNPYGYGYNNPVSFDDPDGRCPSCIVGAIVGAAVDYGTQVASNYVQGKTGSDAWTKNINLSSIALSAVEGGLTSGGSVGKKLLVKTAVLAANNIVEVKTNDKGGIEGKVDKNPRNILKNIAIDATVNGVAKGAGNTGVKLLSKGGVHKGSISTAIKETIKSNGGRVTRELNNNIKTFSKNAIKQTGKTLENTTKAATLKPINDAKDKTNQR